MILSSKTVTALNFLIDLGERYSTNEFISLKEVAKRKDLSKKFLEQIVPLLKKEGIINCNRGNQGGYKLAKNPKEISLKSIFEITEYNLLSKMECSSQAINKTLEKLDEVNIKYLSNVSLQELIDEEISSYSNSYVI